MLSMELYRKQMLTNSILDSADDRILLSDQEDWFGSHVGNDPNDASPKKIIKYCLDCWSRPCDQSCIDTTLLDYALLYHYTKSEQGNPRGGTHFKNPFIIIEFSAIKIK